VTFIPRVEQWVQQSKERLAQAREGTEYHRVCKMVVEQNEALLADLRSKHEPRQKELLPREPGEEG